MTGTTENRKEFEVANFKTAESLFIEASAGTGKTYTIQLMVAKMIAKGTPLKKILIVTYTEKAAGELKDRIRKKINEVLEKGEIDKGYPKEGVDLSLFQKAYQDVDNAAIFTIHSFCQKALKEYAYDAERPFDMTMIDDSAVEDLVEQLIRDKWGAEEEFGKLLGSAAKTSSLIEKIKELFVRAVNLYKGKNDDGEKIIILDAVELPKFLEKELSIETLEEISNLQSYDALKEHSVFKTDLESNMAELVKAAKKEERSDLLLKSVKGWKKGKALFDGSQIQARWLHELPNEVFSYFSTVKELLNSVDKTLQKVRMNKFVIDNLPDLFEEWQKYKAENKLQSFNDMILSVHQAVLSSDNSLKTRLRAQYQYAIIDEFQDTNQLQWDIFRSVFLKECDKPVDKHSLFVVGDPKQSIYSFQGADVNVYTAATKEIDNRNDLFCNFRSTDNVIKGCNILFEEPYFDPKLVEFVPSKWPDGPLVDKKKASPLYKNEEIKQSIWLSGEISPEDFAKTAIAKIVDWCSVEKDGRTRLQVFDKDFDKKNPTKDHPTELKNVTFKDFAVLAKSRSEMEIIEGEMRKVGIPYLRYKEGNLFKSKECAEWIAIFRAIDAPDFSSWNRKLLSEALITDFFKELVSERLLHSGKDSSAGLDELHYVESEEFDKPNNPERLYIATWRSLALKHRYAEMQERIYRDTKIEERLMKVDRLQEISRLRQIGNYAVDYLYNHKCSLEDLVRHLQGLAHYAESVDDENGDLVEKGSDFNAVQVMTIHASKGLEFPVVISVAGFKSYNKNASAPYLYHDEQKKLHIGFGDIAKQNRKNEELEEWRRLFYVDFTRASSILVLPQYKKWSETDSKGNIKYPEFSFLKDAMEKIASTAHPLPSDTEWNPDDMYKKVKKILKKADFDVKNDEKLQKEIEARKVAMSSLQSTLTSKAILQYSYSSLASRVAKPDAENKTDDNEIENADESRADKDDSPLESPAKTKEEQKKIDPDVVLNDADDSANSVSEPLSQAEEKYPRGAKIGNVLHNTLEKSEFENFGDLDAKFEEWRKNVPAKLKNIIKEEFGAESLPLAAHEGEWMEITLRYFYNTLHAALPVIAGGEFVKSVEPFHLIELDENAHKPEVQFGMNADVEDESAEAFATLHRVCKGFIDLLFVRGEGDNKRYSILDWKSDLLDDYSPKSVKEKVDEEYSVQRVLYSYCLIKWLKNFEFCKGMSEQDIFDKHFGGIYYAFLRGTDGKTDKGIYAQTWKDYDALKSAYERVKDLMKQEKK